MKFTDNFVETELHLETVGKIKKINKHLGFMRNFTPNREQNYFFILSETSGNPQVISNRILFTEC